MGLADISCCGIGGFSFCGIGRFSCCGIGTDFRVVELTEIEEFSVLLNSIFLLWN